METKQTEPEVGLQVRLKPRGGKYSDINSGEGMITTNFTEKECIAIYGKLKVPFSLNSKGQTKLDATVMERAILKGLGLEPQGRTEKVVVPQAATEQRQTAQASADNSIEVGRIVGLIKQKIAAAKVEPTSEQILALIDKIQVSQSIKNGIIKSVLPGMKAKAEVPELVIPDL